MSRTNGLALFRTLRFSPSSFGATSWSFRAMDISGVVTREIMRFVLWCVHQGYAADVLLPEYMPETPLAAHVEHVYAAVSRMDRGDM